MKTYEVKIMAQKAGKKPARLGFMDITASSEQEALDIAHAECVKLHNRSCSLIGHRNETTRIWAELAKEECV